MGLILKNAAQEIELTVKGYEISTPGKSYWDNNWLILSCRSTISNESTYGEFPCFMTMELQRLRMLLEQFLNGKLSSVAWNGTEPNFVVTLREDHLLDIFFNAERGNKPVTFSKFVTFQEVQQLIDFCTLSLELYPVRECGTK